MKRSLALIAGILLGAASLFADDQVIGPFGCLNNEDNSFTIPANMSSDLLNVDITPGGKSVKKRHGYGIALTLTVTTSPVHGTYTFYDSNGNTVDLVFNDKELTASVNGGSGTVLFEDGSNGAAYQCTDAEGYAYCANSARTKIIKTDGSTVSNLTVTSTGTMVTNTPERLVQAGFSEAPNRIDFSKSNDFTTWTVGSAATDPIQFTITAPGAKVTHITYGHGRTYWFKNTSFGYILEGATHSDWQARVINPSLGTLDNTSVWDKGVLYFRGNDSHIYAFDGSNLQKLTRDIGTTIGASQSRASNSWTQTTQSDFEAGIITTTTWLSTTRVSGSVMLATATAVDSFVDTSSANFAAGILTNLSTTTIDGSVTLSSTSITGNMSAARTAGGEGCSGNYEYGIVRTTQAVSISSISFLVCRTNAGGEPGDYSLRITDVNFTVLQTLDNISAASISLCPTFSVHGAAVSPSLTFSSGSSVTVQAVPLGACETGEVPPAQKLAFDFDPLTYVATFSSFTTSGNIVSRSFDMGFTTDTWLWDWSTFVASHTLPSGTSIAYQVQSSSASNGTFTSLETVTSGSTPTVTTVQRFIRYKASLATTDISTSPSVQNVTINMTSRIRPTGIFDSQVKNASSLTAWDSLAATKQDNGGTHAFYVRASTGYLPASSSTYPWTAIAVGAVPTISTGTYFQIRDVFTAYSSTTNPILDDFTQNWFEGSASDKSYATYFEDALWWSLASGAGASTNNRIIRYDFLNEGSTLYDIAANGFYVRNQRLYFGSATSGYAFKYGDAESDNGTAIEAYWKSKDFFQDSPFTEKDYTRLSLAAASVDNSTVTVTYALNGSSETAYSVSLQNSNAEFMKKNVNLPLGKTGTTISVKFGNDAADQPFEIFGAQIGYTPKSWRPGN